MVEVVVDTNALLRFILKDVPTQHLEIYELIKKAKDKKLRVIIPEVVLFETYFTLKSYYGHEKAELLTVLESVLSADYLKVENNNIFKQALKIYGVSNLEFVDCFLVAKSKDLGVDLFTFDAHIKKYFAKV